MTNLVVRASFVTIYIYRRPLAAVGGWRLHELPAGTYGKPGPLAVNMGVVYLGSLAVSGRSRQKRGTPMPIGPAALYGRQTAP